MLALQTGLQLTEAGVKEVIDGGIGQVDLLSMFLVCFRLNLVADLIRFYIISLIKADICLRWYSHSHT